MNDDDPLRESFARLRRDDHQAAPSFHRQMQRARNQGSAQPPRRMAWRLAACGAVLLITALPLMPALRTKLRPSLTQVLPVLLPAEIKPLPLLAQFPRPGRASSSDFLLPLHLTLSPL